MTAVDNKTRTVHMHVTGMMCQKSCGTTVEGALKMIDGYVDGKAVFAQSYAWVAVEATATSTQSQVEEEAVEAVEMVGFDATIIPEDDLWSFLESQKNEENSTMTSSTMDDNYDEQERLLLSSHEANGGSSAILSVAGMSCAVCVGRVERMLMGVEGVEQASVALPTHRAFVRFGEHPSQDAQQLAEECAGVVTEGGYDCSVIQVGSGAGTGGRDLQESAAQMEQARQEDLATWRRLLMMSSILTVPLVLLHYRPIPYLMHHCPPIPIAEKVCWQEWIMFVLATMVQLGPVGVRFYTAAYKAWAHGRSLGMDFLVCLGTTANYVYSVVVLLAQLFWSLEEMEATFATGAMLFTFVTLGKFLESYAKGKTASALQQLMELQPHVALKVENPPSEDEKDINITSLETSEVAAQDLSVGDYLYVLPGARIPADGILVATSSTTSSKHGSGVAYVDESALSGEPFPVPKHIGEEVYGATVNQLSTLVLRVTAGCQDSVLAKIVALMEQAQSQKAPIQAQADLIACIFAPTVMFLSFLTLVGWLICDPDHIFRGIMSSIAVIVVACPCALGLATPTAVMVGTGVGATHGLLIKGGAVLEGAHGVDTVILDKTGTLTTGKAVVQQVYQFDDDEICNDALPVARDKAALWLAACAEKQSEHPLAKAIVNHAQRELSSGADVTCSADGVQVSDFELVPGAGVECRVQQSLWGDVRVRVGNRTFVHESVIEGNDNNREYLRQELTGDSIIKRMRSEGQVAVYISVLSERDYVAKYRADGNLARRKIIGVLGIMDPLEPEADSTVAALQKMGVDVWMCTGDDAVTALAVARQVGIDERNVCANVKPEGKADLVTRLQKQQRQGGGRRSQRRKGSVHHQNGRVAMVGDGINDAVALARADVGIAIGAGTEVAVEAADMVLVKSSLHDVVVALHLSRVVFHRIRLNFVWAMAYNLFALPFAAGALYPLLNWRLPPEFAGLMMAFSSVSVVTSSLLLRMYARPTILADGTLERRGICACLNSLFCSSSLQNRQARYSDVRQDDFLEEEERSAHVELV